MLSFLLSGNLSATDIVIEVFAILVIILVAFPFHECAHGVMAKLLGDDTAERQGRLTLNPIAHLDPMGTISMALFGIGWAKPVPVNPAHCYKIKSPKWAMAITALAGPVSNLLLSYIFLIIYKIVFYGLYVNGDGNDTVRYVLMAILTVIDINLYLAVFNLIPIPPFDGSRLFLAFLKPKTYFKIMEYERFIMIGIMLLLFTGILRGPLVFVSNLAFDGLNFLSGFVDLLMR